MEKQSQGERHEGDVPSRLRLDPAQRAVGVRAARGISPKDETTQTYQDALRRLRMGLDETQVRQLLGPPGASEFYKSLDGSPVLVFYYVVPAAKADENGKTERTSLFFENGSLVMWGSKFYE